MRQALLLGLLILTMTPCATRAGSSPDLSRVDGPTTTASVSMSFKDAELTDVLRLFAKVGGVNLIIDPAVKGKTLTLQLADVPWDQALELVLKTHGLAGLVEGNVLRVAPVSSFVAEANASAQLREAREASAELRTTAVRFSNADAKVAEAIVRKNLSPRGTTAVDARTNTLLITDIDRRGLESNDIAEPPPAPVQSGGSASFEVRLLEVSGAVPEGASPATLAELPGARTHGSALVVLGLEQNAHFELGEADSLARIGVSLQLDGGEPVLVLRANALDEGREGAHVARAVSVDQPEAIVLPRRERTGSDRLLVLVIVPA